MFTTAVMRKQLRYNMETLEALEDEIPNALEEESRALAAYQAARLRVSTLRLRQETLIKDAESIVRTLNTMATFPFELLSLIFTYANTQNENWQHYDEHLEPRPVDMERVLLPYRLGSVCRHWRDAVLSTPAAWNYIAVSYKDTKLGKTQFVSTTSRRFHTAIERSGFVPLEIVIVSRGARHLLSESELQGDARDKFLADEDYYFAPMFQHLHNNMHRVRILHIGAYHVLPGEPNSGWEWKPLYGRVIDLLRTPAPALLELRISFVTRPRRARTTVGFWLDFPAQPFPLLLPAAIRLRVLSVSGAPIMCRRPHPGLPSLRRLHLRMDSLYTEHLYDMLAISPSLEHLSLKVEEALDSGNSPAGTELLSRLSRLEVEVGESFGLLADGARLLPKLSHLTIHDVSDLSVTPALAQRLTALTVDHQEDLHEYVGTLRQLKNIEHVEFGANATMRDDLFFEPFLDSRDPMWPKLRTITLSGVEMLSVEQDGILRLLQARNSQRESDDPADGQPGPIEVIDAENSLPQWMVIQIRAIFPERE